MNNATATSEDNFLTRNFDLSQTIFAENDLRLARIHLETWIKREKSSWLKNPQGPLGRYWREDSPIGYSSTIWWMCSKIRQN